MIKEETTTNFICYSWDWRNRTAAAFVWPSIFHRHLHVLLFVSIWTKNLPETQTWDITIAKSFTLKVSFVFHTSLNGFDGFIECTLLKYLSKRVEHAKAADVLN